MENAAPVARSMSGESEKQARYLVISADTHAGPPLGQLREDIESKYWSAFDQHVKETDEDNEARARARAESGPRRTRAQSNEPTTGWETHESLQSGGHPGICDAARRLRDMDSDGIAAEVIFPDFPHIVCNPPPFGAVTSGRRVVNGLRTREFYEPELQLAGCRAYNRWLADFCSVEHERRAGIAIAPFHDVEAVLAEVRWARKAGLRGGLLLPGMDPDPHLPGYNHPMYEPIWSLCEELEMPVNCHGGHEMGDYGPGPDAGILWRSESEFFNHRPLWWFIWGGMLERHPQLNLFFTEQDAGWVPSILANLDAALVRAAPSGRPSRYSLGPKGYWDRQCGVATFISKDEVAARHEIGVATMMWGSDYPHIEGSWPYIGESVRYIFESVPDDELRQMLGENAARAYRFDVDKLAPIADRIGPTRDEIAQPVSGAPADYIGKAFR